MNRSGPYGLLFVALLAFLLAALPSALDSGSVAFAPPWLRSLGELIRQSLVPVFGGVGIFAAVAGISWWLLQRRAESDFGRYEADLTRLANEFGKKIWIKPSLGIGFSSGTGGVRVDIRINPARGFVLVYADCDPKTSFYAMTPQPDRKVPRGWQRLPGGDSWDMFVNHRNKGRQLLGDFAFRDVMDELFGSLNVQIVRHDDDGIEVVTGLVDPGRAEGVIRRALKGVYWLAENNTAHR